MVCIVIVDRAYSPYESNAMIISSICMKREDVSPNIANRRLPNLLMRLTRPSKDFGVDAISFREEWSLMVMLEAAAFSVLAISFCIVTSDSERHGTANGVRPFAADVNEDRVVSPSHALLTTIVRIELRGSTLASGHFIFSSIDCLTKASLSALLKFFLGSCFQRTTISSALLGANPHRSNNRWNVNVPIPSVSSVDVVFVWSPFCVVVECVCIAVKAFINASGFHSFAGGLGVLDTRLLGVAAIVGLCVRGVMLFARDGNIVFVRFFPFIGQCRCLKNEGICFCVHCWV